MKQEGSTLLVREDGVVLATAPFDNNLIGKSINDLKYWNEFVLNKKRTEGIYETNEIEGKSRYISSRKVEGFPLYIISSCEKDKVLEPWIKTLVPSIIILGSLIIVFIILGNTMYKLLKKLDDVLFSITVMSNTDSLTGLYNRRFFNENLKKEISRAERYENSFSYVIMDVDHFKSVNDHFGHEAGDRLLVKMATLLKENIRESDTVARWGGEEFVILLVNSSIEQSENRMEVLRDCIEKADFDQVGHVTCSFGVAEFHEGDSFEELLERADQLLYQSKDKGRNCVTIECEQRD